MGKTIRSEGGFSIVEQIVDYQDGTSSVVGFYVLGPNGKVSPLVSEAQAQATLDDLLDQSASDRPSSSPGP